MLRYILNLIFPPRCIFCNTILTSDAGACSSCYGKIPFMRNSLIFGSTAGSQFFFDDIVCSCEYSGVIKQALIKYKFFNKPSFYRIFARLMHDSIKNMTNCRNFDIIISVPLHKKREDNRGYNQSRLISGALSREMGIPDASRLLSRIRDTGNQSLLGKSQRYTNVKGAFRVVDAKRIKNKSVLLVDDILTTGNTVSECSRALKEAGASRVTVAVIASGRKYLSN